MPVSYEDVPLCFKTKATVAIWMVYYYNTRHTFIMLLESDMKAQCVYVLSNSVCLTSPPLTRGAARGDCIIPLRKSYFSQSSFSVKAAQQWNSIPPPIRDQSTFTLFKSKLKIWLVRNQLCQH